MEAKEKKEKSKKRKKKPTKAELKATKIAEAITMITAFFMKYTEDVADKVKKLQPQGAKLLKSMDTSFNSPGNGLFLLELRAEVYQFYNEVGSISYSGYIDSMSRRQMLYPPEVWTKFLERVGDFSVFEEADGSRLVLLLPVPTFHLSYKGLRKIPFQNMKIRITLSTRYGAAISKIAPRVAEKPFHKGRTPYYHPHVSDNGDVCWGAGSETMAAVSKRWDVISIYEELLQILHTYNAPGVYTPLEMFTDIKGGRCGDCQRWIPFAKIKDTTTTKCPLCRVIHCLKCSKKFAIQNKTSCTICNENIDNNTDVDKFFKTVKICKKCQVSRARKGALCRICGREVCSSHRNSCSDCRYLVCTECQKTCPVCKCGHCGTHLPSDTRYDTLREHDVCNYCKECKPTTLKDILKKKGVSDEDIKATGL